MSSYNIIRHLDNCIALSRLIPKNLLSLYRSMEHVSSSHRMQFVRESRIPTSKQDLGTGKPPVLRPAAV
ncbi:hypothetical protein APED_03310 [Acanthopleuribacter pedis]